MAEQPSSELFFNDACSDCGYRQVKLPEPLPVVGDDFDWLVRDYDGFRLFMLEELAARFPERRRWTPADMEVVIVETLSVVLDQLSDMLDRVHAEAFLETARRPESVRRLLAMIGYDAVSQAAAEAKIPDGDGAAGEDETTRRSRLQAFHLPLQRYLADYQDVVDELSAAQQSGLQAFIDNPLSAAAAELSAVQQFLDNAPDFVRRARHEALESYWTLYPHVMEKARILGPRAIHTQKRMVTENDYAERLEDHPLVLRAHAYSRWTGSWNTLYAAVVMLENMTLDSPLTADAVGGSHPFAQLQAAVDQFNRRYALDDVDWAAEPTPRIILRLYLDAYRMVAQEVFLQDAQFVGINISLSVRVAGNYFQSEIHRDITQALGTELNGFFAPGRLAFGEDVHAGDMIETVMNLDGVEAVCLNRFKRVGRRYPNQADAGRIRLDGLEIATCNNDAQQPALGILHVILHGGQRG
ncbi:hypothetical protein [Nitrosomonas sp.]|uniref:hypothetical protein n=1 Tax=Nitrosomonas sp. TaxID=42353 RepID=UPI002841153A|nr:hypothetical protein [Nitrosomonas sp.]MDR4515030.1 hypothetical protein [Nitrosomonas sp.]